MRSGSGGDRGQSLLQVCFEVVGVFESGIESDNTGAVSRAVGRVEVIAHHEAGDAAPAIADLEELERINKLLHLRFAEALMEDDGEQAGGAGEVSLPKIVAGTGGKSGMENAFYFTSGAEPARQFERGLLNLVEAHGHGLHAAQGKAAIVRRSGAADDLVSFSQALEELGIAHGDGAEQEIAMAANVFGKRLHSDVNAVSKGVKINSRGPGVVQHYQGAVAVSGFGDDGYVLDFHGHGAGILTPDHARVGAEVSRK